MAPPPAVKDGGGDGKRHLLAAPGETFGRILLEPDADRFRGRRENAPEEVGNPIGQPF